MTPWLISTDFDGTLVGFWPDQERPTLFLEWIDRWRRATGGIWIINTGRWVDNVIEIIASLNIDPKPDWIGGGERELHHLSAGHYLPHEPWNSQCSDTHDLLRREFHAEFAEVRTFLETSTRAECIEERDSFAGAMASSLEEADEIDRYLSSMACRIPDLNFMRNDVYFRFCHKNYHKGASLRELQRVTGFTASETFAVGDHYNDLPMLKPDIAGMLACPSNAIQAVQYSVDEAGGYTASQPHQFGVVEALDHFSSR